MPDSHPYTADEMAAIRDYESYQRAAHAFLTESGPETALPPYPDIDALERAVGKGYGLPLGKPTRLLIDIDWD